ncbi:MAG: hypothetical protein LBM71_02875 [Elusimicrobiota bacterium]|jgi:hypothetical protein|nr:hypothetical protein [Elusimicrobiota bacterium]
MKKLVLSALASAMLCAAANAAALTDPFFMTKQGEVLSDTYLAFTNNAIREGDSWALTENINMGAMDNLMVGLSVGWVDMKHQNGSLQDFAVNATYRFFDGLADGYFLDLEAYFSPKMFKSPYNGDNGSAKGSNDIGVFGHIGSAEILQNFTLAARVGLEYVSHTDYVSSGTILSLQGLAKYYINNIHSLEAYITLKSYMGFEKSVAAYGLGIDYAFEAIPEHLALVPYLYFECHNRDIATSSHWGLKARYLF